MVWFRQNRSNNSSDNTTVNMTRVSSAIRNVLQLIEDNPQETEFLVCEELNEAEARKVWYELIKKHAECDFSFELRDGRTISASKFLTEQNIQHQRDRIEALGLNTLPLESDVADEIASFIYERLYEANLTGVYREISAQEVLLGILGQKNLQYRGALKQKLTTSLCNGDTLEVITDILNNKLRIAQERRNKTVTINNK